MSTSRFLVAAAAAALWLPACSSGGSQTLTPPAEVQTTSSARSLTILSRYTARDNATGTIVHLAPPRDATASRSGDSSGRRTLSGANMPYNGGPVQWDPEVFVVFWGPAWLTNGGGDPNGVWPQLIRFYSAIQGSGWLHTVTQYGESDGLYAGQYHGTAVAYYVDLTSSPPSNPTFSDMAAEASKAATHFGASNRSISRANYVVALPHGVVPADGFGTSYCAYHSTITWGGATLAWTNLPYIPDVGGACGAGFVNTPGTLDGVTIIAGHEQAEVETDPWPVSGWGASGTEEIGDKCAWTNLINNPNAGGYPTQPLWSNANNGCVQTY